MRAKIFFVTVAVLTFFTISIVAYADAPGEASPGGPLMGGGGHGGTGGHGGKGGGMGGHGMMGWGRGLSSLWEYLSKKSTDRDQNAYDQKGMEELRTEIGEKREELASLIRSKNPDKKLIDKKIDELNRLELELDIRLRAQEEEKVKDFPAP